MPRKPKDETAGNDDRIGKFPGEDIPAEVVEKIEAGMPMPKG